MCDPTVYNYAHIGNARPAVVFDLLSRLLRYDYREVIYARNFTDVDDKINAAAAAAGVASGALYCRTWLHNSFVSVDGQKMSKSLGEECVGQAVIESNK